MLDFKTFHFNILVPKVNFLNLSFLFKSSEKIMTFLLLKMIVLLGKPYKKLVNTSIYKPIQCATSEHKCPWVKIENYKLRKHLG